MIHRGKAQPWNDGMGGTNMGQEGLAEGLTKASAWVGSDVL